jgi:hypothetical protein
MEHCFVVCAGTECIRILTCLHCCKENLTKMYVQHIRSSAFFKYCFCFFSWLDSPSEPRPPFWGSSVIPTDMHTLGRNPLDELSARRRDLYLTTHNNHRTQIDNTTQHWGAFLYHSTLAHKRIFFKVFEPKIWFSFSPQYLSEIFLILRRIQQDIIINVRGSSYNVPVILVRFWSNLNCLDIVSKNTQMSNLMKIRPVGSVLLHADRWTVGQTWRV